jgi:hypothetical protein
MVILTAVTGLAFGALAAFIGASVLHGDLAGFGELAGALTGMVAGYPIGVIVGIILVKKLLHYQGSIMFGSLGSLCGVVLTIGIAEPLNLNLHPDLLFASFFLASPLLGTLGFNLRRKPSG